MDSELRAVGQHRWDFDILRVTAIVGVIAIHVFAEMVSNSAVRGTRGWWAAVVMDLGFVWAVPLFVMISGALILAPRQHQRGVGDFYRRRLLRLAPAFVFWQVFYIVVIRGWLTGADTHPLTVFQLVADGRTYTHLYFLWLIVGLYAVAPVLAAFLTGGGEERAAWFAGITLAVTAVTVSTASLATAYSSPRPLTLMALTQWIPYVGFFLAGWALRAVRLRGWRLVLVASITVLLLIGIVWQYGTVPGHPLLDALLPVSYVGPVVIAASIGVYLTATGVFAEWQPGIATQRVLRLASEAAFGVFLIHFAIMLVVRRIPFVSDASASVLQTALIWGIVTVASFVIVILLRRVPFVRRLF